jgi:hypothetical protein
MCEPNRNRRKRRLAAVSPGEDVARRIDARLEAGGLHLGHHVAAALDVGVGVGGAADAVGERAAGRAPEDAQRLDALAKLRRVDAGGRVLKSRKHGR